MTLLARRRRRWYIPELLSHGHGRSLCSSPASILRLFQVTATSAMDGPYSEESRIREEGCAVYQEGETDERTESRFVQDGGPHTEERARQVLVDKNS